MSNNLKGIKRPLNVDILCNLRVIGYGKSSFTITSDEGDGYEFFELYMKGEGPDLKPYHFEEWAEQLEYASEWCRGKAAELLKKTITENKET
jgi:hypothetical protein